jgi:hypothetical protein
MSLSLKVAFSRRSAKTPINANEWGSQKNRTPQFDFFMAALANCGRVVVVQHSMREINDEEVCFQN